MTTFTDGVRAIGITMVIWEGNHYSPDISQDFFEVGALHRNDTGDHIVDDLGYLIDRAMEWDSEKPCNVAIVEELETEIPLF